MMATKGHHGAGSVKGSKGALKDTAPKGKKRSSSSAGAHKTRKTKGASSKALGSAFRGMDPYRLAVVLAVILILAALAFAFRAVTKALGPEDYSVSTAEFLENGSIRITSVESFEEEYYDSDELEQEIDEAVSSYNKANGANSVKQGAFSAADGEAKVVLTYRDAKDYEAFNGVPLFIGTVQEAQDQGYDFESIMSAVCQEDSSRILNQETLAQLSAHEVIVLMEQLDVVLSKEILYATPNLGVTDGLHAAAIDTISTDSPAIIILK